MAVKKTQMYRRNLDGTETRLNPLTESQYVLMENGQTVQEVLSDRDSDKYTPVITNSSSTFKVGQGDNVDLSSSMKEGAYDSCVLKGKTMVNCIQEPSSKDIVLPYAFEDGRYVTINDTKESGALGIELKGQTLVNLVPKMDNTGNSSSSVYVTEAEIKINNDITNHRQYYWMSDEVLKKFKTNTKYTIIANITKNTLASSFTIINSYAGTNGDIAASVLRVPVGFTGRFVGVFTTLSDFTGRGRLGFTTGTGNEGELTMKNDMVILEGDWTNKELPFDNFFTGMVGCKMPILHTVGKNLFSKDKVDFNRLYYSASGEGVSGTLTNANGLRCFTIRLKQSTNYTVSLGFATGNLRVFATKDYPVVRMTATQIVQKSGGTQATFNTSDWNYFTVVYYSYNSDNTSGKTEEEAIATIQIEESSTKTTYESYKSSILSLPEEVVLRSLPNGVCDTFNTRTGVYTQRIGEVQLQDVDRWDRYALKDEFPDVVGFYTSFEWQFGKRYGNRYNYHGVLPPSESDKLPGSLTENNEVIVVNKTPHIKLAVNRTRLNSLDSNGLKQWLKSNPITLQYQLATPIITKINLPSTLKSWNTTTHIYSEIPENTLHPILSHSNPSYPVILKPSTKYSIVANSYSNNHTNSAINFNLGGATTSTTVGNRVTTITTPSVLSNELLTMSGRGNKLNNVMVIEGDVVGDEPYFEDICDCKSPILSNCGKNLFDYNLLDKQPYTKNGLTFAVVGDTLTIKGTATSGGYMSLFDYTLFDTWGSGVYANTDKYIELGEGTYCISTHGKITKPEVRLANVFGQGTKLIGHIHPKDQTTFTVSNNERFGLCLVFGFSNGATYDEEIKIQLEKTSSNTFTTYEPYKSNTTTFEQKDGKTIVLRSLPNGVCDTLNVETGEYVQRIGDVVLNGNEEWSYLETNNTFRTNIVADKAVQQNDTTLIYIISDKYTSKSYAVSWNEGKFISLHTNKQIVFRDENFTTSVAFKQWLSQNPVTVQYELATPIITTVDVQGFPYAYTNGHVQLSSGHNGQSLTPKVEFSLSANKTGQIQSNTKRVSAHQKQLDDFEAMMLTSMVQSAYDKAILQFDYEMQMMSLGGE